MGRGRGKGKKLTVVASHEHTGSGDEDHIAEFKRNEEPEMPIKSANNQQESVKDEIDETKIKPILITRDEIAQESGKKRKRHSQLQENSAAVLEGNGAVFGSEVEETKKTTGYRQTGSRRKSKPHRAAEAVVPVMAVYNYKGF